MQKINTQTINDVVYEVYQFCTLSRRDSIKLLLDNRTISCDQSQLSGMVDCLFATRHVNELACIEEEETNSGLCETWIVVVKK